MAKGRGSDVCLVCGHRHVDRRCNPRHLRGIDHANQQAADAEDRPDEWPGHPGHHRTYSDRLADGEAFARGSCGLMILAILLGSCDQSPAVPAGNRAGVVEVAAAKPSPTDRPDPARQLRRLFDALREVESGGETDPSGAVGDGGKALGPYQIWRSYWTDALEHAPDLGGVYADVREARYAEWIILAYWLRWCPDALERLDLRRLAIVHHLGGPNPDRDPAEARRYWRKVRIALGD